MNDALEKLDIIKSSRGLNISSFLENGLRPACAPNGQLQGRCIVRR